MRRSNVFLLGLIVAVSAAPAAMAQSQPGQAPTLQEAVMWWTHSGDMSAEADGEELHMTVDVTYGHPDFFVASGTDVPVGVLAGQEATFFLTENIHHGELTSEPTAFDLYVDGKGPFSAVEVRIINANPHHRLTQVTYRDSEGEAGVLIDDSTAVLSLVAAVAEHPLRLEWQLQGNADVASGSEIAPTAVEGDAATHSHDHPAVLANSDILPPLGEQGKEYQLVSVVASDSVFTPNVIHVKAGEPLVVLFNNPTDTEHHFHINELEPEDLSWFMVDNNRLDAYETSTLLNVSRAADHICDSATGICKLGINVHLHANPQSFDAVMFTAPVVGSFEVECPLHDHATTIFVVE